MYIPIRDDRIGSPTIIHGSRVAPIHARIHSPWFQCIFWRVIHVHISGTTLFFIVKTIRPNGISKCRIYHQSLPIKRCPESPEKVRISITDFRTVTICRNLSVSVQIHDIQVTRTLVIIFIPIILLLSGFRINRFQSNQFLVRTDQTSPVFVPVQNSSLSSHINLEILISTPSEVFILTIQFLQCRDISCHVKIKIPSQIFLGILNYIHLDIKLESFIF